MKKSVSRRKRIDAFSIDIIELNELCGLMGNEFSIDDNASTKIEFNFKEETLEFKSVDDIEKQGLGIDFVNDFEISMYGGGKHVTLKSNDVLSSIVGSSATLWSSSDSISWCTGIIETVRPFLRKKRIWFYFIVNSYFLASLYLICIALIFMPDSIEKSIHLYFNVSEILVLSVKTAFLVFWIFCIIGKRIMLPTGRIVLSKSHFNFVNFFLVLGSLAGIVTMIVTVLSFLK